VTIRQEKGGVLARAPGRWNDGVLDVPIDPPARETHSDVDVCVRNTGDNTVVFTGILTKYGNVMLKGERVDLALTMLWFTPDSETWLSELGAIVPRVGHARVGGTWAFWWAALLLLSAVGLAITAAVRVSAR
jgi:hypothetical protein